MTIRSDHQLGYRAVLTFLRLVHLLTSKRDFSSKSVVTGSNFQLGRMMHVMMILRTVKRDHVEAIMYTMSIYLVETVA